jgi:hypothetical protein
MVMHVRFGFTQDNKSLYHLGKSTTDVSFCGIAIIQEGYNWGIEGALGIAKRLEIDLCKDCVKGAQQYRCPLDRMAEL